MCKRILFVILFSFAAFFYAPTTFAQSENSCKRTYRADMGSGGFTKELINGFQRELFACQMAEIKQTSSITQNMCNNINTSCSGFRDSSNCAETYHDCRAKIGHNSTTKFTSAIDLLGGTDDFIQRSIECRQRGGTMLNGACVDESQTSDAKTEEDIRKELGTDLATLKAVSDIGIRNGLRCAALRKNSAGFMEVQNLCAEPIDFGYCYSEWVHKRGLKPLMKCDSDGTPSWAAAASVKGNSARQPAAQDGASMRVIIGPCMSEVNYNGRIYSYSYSRRMTTGPVDGRGGSYKCLYFKAAGQD